MQWDLAGYDSHPIDGDAGRVSSLAANLGTIAEDIRTQVDRISAINSGDFWESSAGSADNFQEVVEDLPEKLGLVATRYENVASALDTFHPVLADTKQDAEYWIEQASEAQEEVDRCESGVQLMEDFADQAERDAETANDDREDGDPEVEADEWQGENYHDSLAQAQDDLNTAITNCQSAVGDFESAAENCANAIHEAGNDDLKNESGLFAGIGRAFGDFMDWAGDFIEVYVQILQVIGTVLAIVALFVPGLNLVVLAIGAAVLLGTILLYLDGRRSGWDVAAAGLGVAAGGLGAVSTFAQAGRLATTATWANRALGVGTAWVDVGGDGPEFIDFSDPLAVGGAVLTTGAIGLDSTLSLRNVDLGAGPDSLGSIPMRQFGDSTLNGGWRDGTTSFKGIAGAVNSEVGLGTTDFANDVVRPQSEQSGFQGLDTSFEGLDVAVSPGDMQVPEISMPDIGTIDIPPMEPMDVPQIAIDVETPVGGGSW